MALVRHPRKPQKAPPSRRRIGGVSLSRNGAGGGAMAGPGKPTVVLVHGALGGAWIWELVGKELDARGIAHVQVDLPSVGVDVDPTSDMHGDAAHVRAVIDGLSGPVVLCGNSYGGVVITRS